MVNVAEALALAWRNVDKSLLHNPKLTILLENTAGAGTQLGGKLDELSTIRTLVAPYLGIPVGYCLDTCHCYVAGFDLASQAGFDHLLAEAETHLQLKNVPIFHANDAKMPLGSHLDRHANIGAGHIGLEGFRRLLNHPQLCDKAFILETPVDHPGDDKRELKAFKKLVSPKTLSTLKKLRPLGATSVMRD